MASGHGKGQAVERVSVAAAAAAAMVGIAPLLLPSLYSRLCVLIFLYPTQKQVSEKKMKVELYVISELCNH